MQAASRVWRTSRHASRAWFRIRESRRTRCGRRGTGQTGGIKTRAPGGGSDHEPFLYLLGIPTLEFGYAGAFGVYHSVFDDLRYATTAGGSGLQRSSHDGADAPRSPHTA